MSYNQCGSSESEENLSGKRSPKNYGSLSNVYQERCSSTISECQSSSPKRRSNNNNARGIQSSISGRKDALFELLTSSVIREEQDQTGERRMQFGAKIDSSFSPKSIPTKSDPINNPISTTQADVGPCSSPLKQTPKTEVQFPLLSRMRCVSATGNSPNGKKINGLLCNYNSKTEISMVCFCHGKSFSPSEFVEHAGGVDISHPLMPPMFLMEPQMIFNFLFFSFDFFNLFCLILCQDRLK
ncbi:ninja-family protein AFP1-like isoform X2 [Lycium ferocissimum]|uniref:ninja-family protein AFP1-like isoform X2 n=1 Tax=Lycium ferocissimum TaxID=112874 RepID=UPI00281574C0|nr:ninja-family protein AFP1-like isoform X2 [Lycium ferocissimum]